MDINSVKDFARALKAGEHTFPGCYIVRFCCSDGGILCFDCAKENKGLIYQAIREDSRDGWKVEVSFLHEEGESLWCDHCSKELPSEYGEVD